MVSDALIVMDSCFVAVCDALSVACTVNVDEPAVLGVPLITPAADKESPAGSEPALTVQV